MAEAAPIIIKKVKGGGGHGHHGGAWKVAYADFVTAMMAFFLLMWLLNATEAEKLAGLADYFAPTVGVAGQMGVGFRGGKAPISDGISSDINANKGIIFGGVMTGPVVKVTEELKQETQEVEQERINISEAEKQESSSSDAEEEESFQNAEKALEKLMGDIADETLRDAVGIKRTPDGLEIDIKSTKDRSMFDEDGVEFAPHMQPIIEKVAFVIKQLPNYVRITGHTSSIPIRGKKNYGNWEQSADRANAARRMLIDMGVESERVVGIVGRADNEPLDSRNPDLYFNNRVSVLLLKKSILSYHKRGAPEDIFIKSIDNPLQGEEPKTAKEVLDDMASEDGSREGSEEEVKQPEQKGPVATQEEVEALRSIIDETEQPIPAIELPEL